MKAVERAKIKVAALPKKKFSLPFQHLTTASFMQFNPVLCREIIPNSSVNLRNKMFLRCLPLDRPCLGSAQIKTSTFFVPMRTIWEPWSDFITDTPHNQPGGTSIIQNVPVIQNDVLYSFFTDATVSTSYATAPLHYDFVSGPNYYVLTSYGRQCMKILESLGYKIIFGANGLYEYSVLPLLALAKVYIDWFYPNAYAHYGIYAVIDGIFQRQTTYALNLADFRQVMSLLMQVAYDNDFWTSVFDNPVAPNSGTGSTSFNIDDITLANFTSVRSHIEQQGTSSTPIVKSANNNVTNFTQYIDTMLKSVTNYLRRHQLAGSRALDRYLATWGIALDADKLKRCYYLNTNVVPFQISDVMSNSDTVKSGSSDGASLGSYAGKGVAYSDGENISFDTDEFGYLIVVNTIIPDVAYVSGVDRNVCHITKFDFYTPEFDGTPNAVMQAEVYFDRHGGNAVNGDLFDDKPFGYAQRYYEYKIPYQRMTGFFSIDSVNSGLLSWSTARLFNYGSANDIVHSLDFMLGLDSNQYSRIFLGYSDKSTEDEFYMIFHSDLDIMMPVKPLYDVYEFEGEESHKSIITEPNGVRVN